MRKNKKSQSQETTIKVTEIDYDKLAKSITKAILESKNEEDKQIERKEEELNRNWHKTIGLKEHTENEKLFKRIGISISNFFHFLKVFVFYKKSYARDTRMAFAFMAMISSVIFEVLELLFIAISVAVIYLVVIKTVSIWFLSILLLTLFFANLMRIIRMEIDQMENREMINMVFSSLMAFIAALFTVLSFIVILLERQNNLKDLKSSRNSIIQRIVIMNMHSEPVLQGMPEIFNWIQFG